jgi:hypothetical protein
MSPKWYKSFKFKEFDKEMLEKKVFEGYEEVHLHQLNLQKAINVGKLPLCW